MGYVQERNGRFRARRRVDGKLISRTFASRSEAYAWVDGEEPTVQPELPVALERINPTVKQFIDAGGHPLIHMRESTRVWTKQCIDAHIITRWGDTRLADITHSELQAWVNTYVSRGKHKPSSVIHYARLMKRILDSAVKAGYLETNPAGGLVLPSKNIEDRKRYLTSKEIDALTAAMSEDVRAFIPLGVYGGLRIGEIFGLTWGNVDLFTGLVKVRQSVTEVSGHLHVGPVKTRAGRRDVPIPRVAVHALRDHQTRLGQPGPDEWVFPGPNGPSRTNQFRRLRWEPAVKRAKLGKVTPHDLRHTAVSLWIAAGYSAKEVSVRAGHTSVSFTFDTYGHLFPSESSMDKLETLIKRGVK